MVRVGVHAAEGVFQSLGAAGLQQFFIQIFHGVHINEIVALHAAHLGQGEDFTVADQMHQGSGGQRGVGIHAQCAAIGSLVFIIRIQALDRSGAVCVHRQCHQKTENKRDFLEIYCNLTVEWGIMRANHAM